MVDRNRVTAVCIDRARRAGLVRHLWECALVLLSGVGLSLLWPGDEFWMVPSVLAFLWMLNKPAADLRRARPYRVTATASGLLLRFYLFSPQQLVPWSHVRGVSNSDDGTAVHLDEGTIVLGPEATNAVRLGHAVAAYLTTADADATIPAATDDETFSALISADGAGVPEARVEPGPLAGAAWVAALSGVAAAVVAGTSGTPQGASGLLLTLAIGIPVVLASFVESASMTIRVEPGGLVIRRRRDRTAIPWADVRSVSDPTAGRVVRTVQGDVALPGSPDGLRVLTVVRRVLAARDAGQVLPRLGFVGDAAISPVREGEERAERGISLSADTRDDTP
ncbi:MAG: hypothetical protein HYU66_05110 [Armatimonadetes bacterium]|nr:hypothetical protein [Armatimonadota bacterium]